MLSASRAILSSTWACTSGPRCASSTRSVTTARCRSCDRMTSSSPCMPWCSVPSWACRLSCTRAAASASRGCHAACWAPALSWCPSESCSRPRMRARRARGSTCSPASPTSSSPSPSPSTCRRSCSMRSGAPPSGGTSTTWCSTLSVACSRSRKRSSTRAAAATGAPSQETRSSLGSASPQWCLTPSFSFSTTFSTRIAAQALRSVLTDTRVSNVQ
mmetsp:Transcript_2104/g.6037  ORF Transcript_2104/g.6037 Transcript_2104/m.6037 type:complete len:216 (-) Transcript_2104:145-792(-)